MEPIKRSEKIGKGIVSLLDSLIYSPTTVARVIAQSPGPIQHRMWVTIKVLIRIWAIEGKMRTYDPEYKEIHDWAERHNDDNIS